MSSSWVNRDAKLAHPFVGADTNGIYTVHRIAASTSAASVAVPKAMEGKFCRVRPVGCSIQYGFSNAQRTLVWDQTSALGTGDAGAGATLADGEFGDGIIPMRTDTGGQVYFCHIAETGGSGFVELWVSEVIA